MQVYLLKDLPGKGKAGEIINVNDGYGRNFIIKNGIGRAADNATISQVKSKQESSDFHRQEEIAAIKKICEKLKEVKVDLYAKVGANGKMFGTITGQEIAAELAKLGYDIDKKNLVIPAIKELGIYTVKAKFNHSLSADFTMEVMGRNGN